MKKFCVFLLISLLFCSFCVSAFAEIVVGEDENGNQTYTSTLLSDEENAALLETQEILYLANGAADEFSGSELVSVQASSYTVSASDANGFKAVILDLIGDYETVVTDYTYRQGTSSYESHSIDIQPDFTWIASFIMFALVVYCVFRLGGAFIG